MNPAVSLPPITLFRVPPNKLPTVRPTVVVIFHAALVRSVTRTRVPSIKELNPLATLPITGTNPLTSEDVTSPIALPNGPATCLVKLPIPSTTPPTALAKPLTTDPRAVPKPLSMPVRALATPPIASAVTFTIDESI